MPKIDRLHDLLAQRLNRRGFLGTMAKGATAFAVATSGLFLRSPLGTGIMTALGCTIYCYGCLSPSCRPISCFYCASVTYEYPTGGQGEYLCDRPCPNQDVSCCCFVPPGGPYINDCPCGVFSCGEGDDYFPCPNRS
jgi:hypothetical protein